MGDFGVADLSDLLILFQLAALQAGLPSLALRLLAAGESAHHGPGRLLERVGQ